MSNNPQLPHLEQSTLSISMDRHVGLSPELQAKQDEKNQQDFIYATNQKLQNLQFAIDQLSSGLADHIAKKTTELKQNDINFNNLNEFICKSIKDFKKSIEENSQYCTANLYEMKAYIQQLKDNYMQYDHFQAYAKDQHDMIKQVSEDLMRFRKEILETIQRQTYDFDLKLAALRAEFINKPSDTEVLRKEFDDKLELVALNGTNSVIRSSNNEKQLHLIEKKIEAINLNIKRLDLERTES